MMTDGDSYPTATALLPTPKPFRKWLPAMTCRCAHCAYEDRGLISPKRVNTTRYYSPHDEIRLQLIQKGKKFGLSLSAIQEIMSSSSQPEEESLAFLLSKAQIIERIEQLEKDRVALTGALEELYEARKKLG